MDNTQPQFYALQTETYRARDGHYETWGAIVETASGKILAENAWEVDGLATGLMLAASFFLANRARLIGAAGGPAIKEDKEFQLPLF